MDIQDCTDILEKLNQEDSNSLLNWSLTEKYKLLRIYLLLCQKEELLYELVYDLHGCDSYEDIFRDYRVNDLETRTDGVEIAVNELNMRLKQMSPAFR